MCRRGAWVRRTSRNADGLRGTCAEGYCGLDRPGVTFLAEPFQHRTVMLGGAMGRSLAVFTLPAFAVVVGLSIQTRAAASVTHETQAAVAPREDVLPALLIEVRGLRVAM